MIFLGDPWESSSHEPMHRYGRWLVFLIMIWSLLPSCVKSNLDNAFDPRVPLGLAIGLNALDLTGSGAAANSASSVAPGGSSTSSVCDGTLLQAIQSSNATAARAAMEAARDQGQSGSETIDLATISYRTSRRISPSSIRNPTAPCATRCSIRRTSTGLTEHPGRSELRNTGEPSSDC